MPAENARDDIAGGMNVSGTMTTNDSMTANANPPPRQLCLFIYIVDIETTYSGF